MADGDALSVQESQDQQSNSVKHPETVQQLYNGAPPVPFINLACVAALGIGGEERLQSPIGIFGV